ncbi:alpha-2-macroglobulin family protein [Gillisia hiemivivida]|uniref:Alpha-2-macroglobulin domain-containing protein n=1 Tax=Gillisia hiemivivida TaxID=291190 RepID=A0A5C6ZXU5_9FLAO|nr:MG2 domain-containing protein [Gillisia hiemivivida]TXD95777.1 hypothetical protein ES724_01760 [Gillisia hiemivivida]
MNKFLTGIIFLFSFLSFSQQTEYNKLWEKIDSLEIIGKTDSANEFTKELIVVAANNKEYSNLLKGKLFHYKFHQINHEDSNQYILNDLNTWISKVPSPYKNILRSYKADFIMDYYRQNRWKLKNRSKIDNPKENELETWSMETLHDTIKNTFERSLVEKEVLIATSNSEISLLLDSNLLTRKYHPSVYDLLVSRLIEFYSESSFFTNEFAKVEFNWGNPKLFSTSLEFSAISILEIESSEIKTLKLYQQIERLHLQDKDPQSLVYWTIERLKFLKNKLDKEKSDILYLNALKELSKNYKNKDVEAVILYEIAYHYYSRSDTSTNTNINRKAALLYPNYLKNAIDIIDHLIANFPNTSSAQNAVSLKSTIKAPVLNSKVPSYLAVNEPGRIFISFKNIDTLNYKIIQVTKNFSSSLSYKTRDSNIKSLAEKHKASTQIVLPGLKDYNLHSTEIAFQGKDPGTYLVYLSTFDNYYSYGFFQVSNIAVSKLEFNTKSIFHAVDRKSGKNLKNVKFDLYGKEKLILTEKTDSNGVLTIKNTGSGYRNSSMRFSYKEDTLITNYNRGYYRRSNTEQPLISKTMIYLDRSIYRPGQTVFFKGVLLEHENDSTRTVPNEYVPVYVDDPNGEEIADFRLKTNKYGSFTGSFKLPKDGITGEFSIYTEKDSESETPFWNKIYDDGEFYENHTVFNVEEYKRPTFKIAFDTIKDSFKLKDSVSISGTVKSFMGAKISDAKVKFEVKRERFINSWWYRYYENAVVIYRDSVKTDKDGNFRISFIAEAEESNILNPDLIYRYTVDASATDITGETRSESKEIRIGNKNLVANLQLQENVVSGDTLKITAKTNNLNDNLVPVNGVLKIFKLKSPNRILQNRLWEAPEFNLISEEEFIKLFPEEPYKDGLPPEEWPKSQILFQVSFDSDGIFEETIPVQNNWEEGKYLVELEVENNNNITISKKIFAVNKKENNNAANKERLLVKLQNKDIREDGFANLLIKTAYKDLNLQVSAFNGNSVIFNEFLKIDGSREVKIPVGVILAPEIRILVSGVKNNAVIEETIDIPLENKINSLSITTKTFRNKIKPGLDETWSFDIKNELNEIPDAEILASMYDVSLDQFKIGTWETNPNFSFYRSDFPNYQNTSVGDISQLTSNIRSAWRYRPQKLFFDKLDDFGFYFGRPNSYNYRYYIQRKKIENDKPVLEGNLRGRIIDEQGMILPGVNIIIKDSRAETQTNFNGEFALNVNIGDVLTISIIGYTTFEYKVLNRDNVYLMLEEDSSALDEVVVIGYGIVADEEALVETDISSVLQGKVAGVEIKNNRIMIRGESSLKDGKTPLFIVDGKQVEEYNLNSGDILNIEILKAETAVAIYGTAASNGAVIITTKKGLAELGEVEARKNLDETAFFFPNLILGEDGNLEFSFTSPEALTSWKFRLLAHTKNWSTGKLQKNVITQKELNVIPNPPRFLREGDSIVFKAKVSNLSSESMTGNAILKLFNAVTMEPIDSIMGNIDNLKIFKMGASQSHAVSWKLFVPEDIPAVTYRILAKAGNFSDGEENLLPVLKNRMLVKESIPFFVRAGEKKDYFFESLLDNKSESLQNHKFTITYSSNPAWYAIQSLPYLMEYEHECSEQIFSRIFANSLGSKIVNSQPKIADVFREWEKDSSLVSNLDKNEELKSILLAETPWVRDAESETAQKKQVANLFKIQKLERENNESMSKLLRMQNSSGAFPWFSGGRDSYFITRHIVEGFGRLQKLGVDTNASTVLANSIRYLDNEFLNAKTNRQMFKSEESFRKSNYSLYYLYARSYHLKAYPLSKELVLLANEVIEVQKENWIQKSLYNKGILSYTLNQFGHKDVAAEILNSLKETAVYSENYGMYWKENQATWFYNRTPVETQALLIEAFSDVLNDQSAVEEMKVWLLQNKRTNHWATTKSTTAASYALLMKGGDWLSVSDNTEIKLGGEKIDPMKLEEIKKEAGTGYLKINWKGEEIVEDFGKITIENNNTTAGYGGAYWQYFENLDKINDHTESPLNIEKELYLNNPGDVLQQISETTPIKLGDLITIRLIVRTTSDMEFIHLKDMRASGFEPTDVLSEYKSQDNTYYYQSTRDAATHFFFDNLRKGTYVLEYTVRANNIGSFSNGITLIESMYAPEFSGHTQGISVKIKE